MRTPGDEYPVTPSKTNASGVEAREKHRIHRGVHRERCRCVFDGTTRLVFIYSLYSLVRPFPGRVPEERAASFSCGTRLEARKRHSIDLQMSGEASGSPPGFSPSRTVPSRFAMPAFYSAFCWHRFLTEVTSRLHSEPWSHGSMSAIA
jgi:hypothetical protein